MSIDKDCEIPLFVQMKEHIKDMIRTGKYASGDVLPSERELARRMGVSRVTVRKALDALEEDGVIVRSQGQGTFVSSGAFAILDNSPGFSSQQNGYESCIGVVLAYFDSYTMDILKGIQTVCRNCSYHVILRYPEGNAIVEYEDITQLLEEGIRGMIIFPCDLGPTPEAISLLERGSVPVVLLDRYPEGIECDVVESDNFAGGYIGTKHLISLGHTRIAFVVQAETEYVSSVRERLSGYKRALETLPVSLDNPLVLRDFFLDHEESERRLLDYVSEVKPTAIFASNDLTAMAIYRILGNAGIRIPDDIALVGFDKRVESQYLQTSLTSVKQCGADIGAIAASRLIRRMQGEELKYERIRVPVSLEVGESCGKSR